MPAMKYSIPITIRNFFNRDSQGRLGDDNLGSDKFAHIGNFVLLYLNIYYPVIR